MKNICFALALFAGLPAMAQQSQVKKAVQEDQYQKHGKPGEDKLNEWIGGKVMNVKTEPEYAFTMSVTQHMVTYKNGKPKDESDMKTYTNVGKKLFAMEGDQSGRSSSKKKAEEKIITVYDNGNAAMLMFNVTKKTLFAMNLNAFRSRESMENDGKTPRSGSSTGKPKNNCTKTGKTKQILGYTCYEYICKKEGDEKSYTQMWMTTDVAMGDMPATAGNPAMAHSRSAGIAGAMLEMNSYEDGEIKMSMTVTEINKQETFKLTTADFKRAETPEVRFGY